MHGSGKSKQLINMATEITSVNLNHHRRDDIQGLRALAVIAVICFHARLHIPGGYTGVDIFFVISGFVITLMMQRQWERDGQVNLSKFYLNRFKRLSPALSLVVTITVVLSALFLSPLGSNVTIAVKTGMRAVLMTANVYIAKHTGGYFDPAAETNPLLNTWSLSVEEQFYLFFPALLLLAFVLQKKGKFWRHSALTIVSSALILSIAAMYVSWSGIFTPKGSLISFYNPIPRAWEFSAGAILALLIDKIKYSSKLVTNLIAVVGTALIAFSFFGISGKANYPSIATLWPVLGAVALIVAGSCKNQNPVSRFLSSSPMAYIGDISYSWYLWHWPLIVFASVLINDHPSTLTLAAIASLAPAIASYRWVEQPLRKFPVTGIKQSMKFLALTLVPPLLVCSLVLKSSNKAFWVDDIREFQSTYGPLHIANIAGCGQGKVPVSSSDNSCLWNANASGTPIYLIGDSNADHFSEAVIYAGEKMHSPVRVFTKGGCAFIGRSWSDRSDIQQDECLNYVDGSISLLNKSSPGIVVIGLSESTWSLSSSVGPDRASETSSVQIAHTYLQQQLQDKVAAIVAAGHKVVLLQPVAKFVADGKPMFDAGKCSTISIIHGSCPKRVSVPLKDYDLNQVAAMQAISSTVKKLHTDQLDFGNILCQENRCFNIEDGVALYRDAGHLSVKANIKLGEEFFNKFTEIKTKLGNKPLNHP